MKRIYKNILCIFFMILGIGIIFGTIIVAKNYLTNSNQNTNMNGAPAMQGANSNGQPPSMPSGDNSNGNEQPPSMPSGDNSNSEQPPSMPGGDSSSVPTPSSDNNSNGNNNQSQLIKKSSVPTLTVWYIVTISCGALIFSISLLYLIFSLAGSKGVFISGDKVIIFILSSIIVTALISFGTTYYTNNNILLPSTANNQMQMNNNMGNNSSANANGKKKVTSDETLKGEYSSSDSDENAVLVTDGASATIENATIDKSGDSQNTESADFYGMNAAVLTQTSSTTTIKNTTITTNGKGANAVFANGENACIYISDSTIKTTGSSSSRGLDATYGGYIEGKNLKITTQGGSSATLATDRGEGTVKVSNSNLETNGKGSPVIYSTGDISITDTKGTASASQMVVVEGKNTATVTSSKLYGSGGGNRESNADQAGVMIYQSMSGDASEGTGTFTAKDSSLNILSSSNYYITAPMFFVTNTTAAINLENTTLNYGSNILLSAKGTSEWGNSGSNGGDVTLNAINQILVGDIEFDNLSTLTLNLKDSSTYKGTINSSNSAKSITINLSKNSKWTLTGDTYISELNDDDSVYSNIDLNGYKLYINGNELKK